MSFESEIVPLYDLGLGPQGGRQNSTSLFLAVNFRNDPGFVLPIRAIRAPPVRMGQEMRTGLEKDFYNRSTGNTLGLNHQHKAAGYHEGDGPD